MSAPRTTAPDPRKDWTADPRFGTDDRTLGSLDDLEALCRRRLAEIVGPEGPAADGQIFRYERECTRYGAHTGEYDDGTPWIRDSVHDVENDPLTVAYRRVFGADRWEDDEVHDDLYERFVEDHQRDGATAGVAHPWELREPTGSLEDLLVESDDTDPPWLIEDVWPHAGKIVLAAPAKAGKSTLVGNVLRSLADGVPLFGPPVAGIIGDPAGQPGYPVAPLNPGETIFLADLELSRGQLRRWLRDQGIRRTDRIHYELFRGRPAALDVRDPQVRTRLATRLRALRTRVIVLDPVGVVLAALELNEASNPDVRRYLTALESLALEAGVGELLVVHHMGHTGERSRGATAFRDWPDAEWRLIRPGAGEGREAAADAPRFFAAAGRDVAVPETALRYDEDTRHLTLITGDRDAFAADQHTATVATIVEAVPGLGRNELETRGQAAGMAQRVARSAIRTAVTRGEIHTHPGPNKRLLHHPGEDCAGCRVSTAAA